MIRAPARVARSTSSVAGSFDLRRLIPAKLLSVLAECHLAIGPEKGHIMNDETPTGSPGASKSRRHSQVGGEHSPPLQTRANFLKNWDWQSVISINRGACQRAKAQHGVNSEAEAACGAEWEKIRQQSLSLGEVLDILRGYHRTAPFLFFNGNTFASIGRELALVLFSDLPPVRKRECASAIAHYIAGVLDRDSMVQIVDSLCDAAAYQPGDWVQSFRGSTRGRIVRFLDDGRVVWQPDGSHSELIALPECLMRLDGNARSK
jgi:hypothetical protein